MDLVLGAMVWGGVWAAVLLIVAIVAGLLHRLIPEGRMKRILYRRFGG